MTTRLILGRPSPLFKNSVSATAWLQTRSPSRNSSTLSVMLCRGQPFSERGESNPNIEKYNPVAGCKLPIDKIQWQRVTFSWYPYSTHNCHYLCFLFRKASVRNLFKLSTPQMVKVSQKTKFLWPIA